VFCSQKLREEFIKLTNPAVASIKNASTHVQDVQRLVYYEDLKRQDPDAEMELIMRSGFTVKVAGNSRAAPQDWFSYKNLVVDSTEYDFCFL
jgi:hypothetical protein